MNDGTGKTSYANNSRLAVSLSRVFVLSLFPVLFSKNFLMKMLTFCCREP